jgi:hypothetical protein
MSFAVLLSRRWCSVNLDLVGAVNMVLRNNATASQQQEIEGNEDALTA